MSLSKEIILSVSDYAMRLSGNLNFYVNDTLDLIFILNKWGVDNAKSQRDTVGFDLTDITAYLMIENGHQSDSIESVSIVDNKIFFKLTKKYTIIPGVGRMQLKLVDSDGCELKLPPFKYEIQNTINEWNDLNPSNELVLSTNSRNALLTEDGKLFMMSISSVDNPNLVRINDLQTSDEIDYNDFTIVNVKGETKKVPISSIKCSITERKNIAKIPQLEDDVNQIANNGTTTAVVEKFTKQQIDKFIKDGTMGHLTLANGGVTSEKLAEESVTISKIQKATIRSLEESSSMVVESNLFDSEILDNNAKNMLVGMENSSFASFELTEKATYAWNHNYNEGVYPERLKQPILEHVYKNNINGLFYVGLISNTQYTKGLLSYGLWVNTSDLKTIKLNSPNVKFDILLICSGGTGENPNHCVDFTLDDLSKEGFKKTSSNIHFKDMTFEVVSVKGDWSYIRTYVNFGGNSGVTYRYVKWYLRSSHYGPCSEKYKIRTQGNVALFGSLVKPYRLYSDIHDRSKLNCDEIADMIDEIVDHEINAYDISNTATNYMSHFYDGLLGQSNIGPGFTAEYIGYDDSVKMYPINTAPVWRFHLDVNKNNYTPKYSFIGYRMPINLKDTNKYFISCWISKADIDAMPDKSIFCFVLGGLNDTPALSKSELILDSNYKAKVTTNGDELYIKSIKDGDWVFVVGGFELKQFGSDDGVFYYKMGYNNTNIECESFGLRTVGHTIMSKAEPKPYRIYGNGIATLNDVTELNTKTISEHLKMYHWPSDKPEWNNAIRHIYKTDLTNGYNISIFSDTTALNNSAIEYVSDENSNTYGVPNSVSLVGTCRKSKYAPQLSFYASVKDLALIGVVADNDNPPTISVRGLISKLDYNENKNNMQVFVCLRYGDSTNIGVCKPSQEVTFVNGVTKANGSGLDGKNELFNWGHTSRSINNHSIFGYVHEGIPIPETLNGMPFVGVIIRLYGYINDPDSNVGKQLRLTGLLPSIIKGSKMETYSGYPNLPEDFSSTNGGHVEKEPEKVSNVVDLKNVDRITLLGNSYSASHYTMKDKAYVNILSALSDYNWENYSRSGDDVLEIESRVQHGSNDYGLPFKDFNTTYGLILEYTNSGKHRKQNGFYFDNLEKLIGTIESMGVKPIIATEFLLDKKSDLAGMKAIADRHRAMFIDVYTKASLFRSRQTGSGYLPFWGNNHPATRTNTVLYHELLKRLNTLPRPNRSIKVFRKRKGTSNTLDDLNYDDHYQRMMYWKELSVGHHYLNNPQYYDALNVNSSCSMKVLSEYLRLMKNEPMTFNKYALVEIIVPSTADKIQNVKLILKGTSGLRVWIKNFIYPIRPVTDHLVFEMTSPISVGVGDVYSYNGVNHTVSGLYGNNIVTSTVISSEPNYQSGTLIKVSGVGPSSISFIKAFKGFHIDYYNALFKPKGKFEEISGNDGIYIIDDVKKYMDYDKFVFVIEKEGDFQLSDIRMEWEGDEGKINNAPEEYEYFRGSELLSETKFGTSSQLSRWTKSSGIVEKQPMDVRKPFGIDGIIELSPGQYVEQNFTLGVDNYRSTDINISVWARTFPEIFDYTKPYPDQAPINSDTYDFGEYEVELIIGSNDGYRFKMHSCLDWVDEEIKAVIPPGCTSGKIRITCKAKNLQLSKVSILKA